ncbi:MAG: hypothetical protein HY975_02515 [Candidatus Kerfeldbacteria bacterium]|nr:hypothetical protein [Candidatus Kerfeldbacteria bacterium]
MDYHRRYPRDEQPFRISLMRFLTVATFAFVLFNCIAWPQGLMQADMQYRIHLSDAEIAQGQQLALSVIEHTRTAGRQYSTEQFGEDYSRLIGLGDALQKFGGYTPGVTPSRPVDPRVMQLGQLVEYARELSKSTFQLSTPSEATGLGLERNSFNAVNTYRERHGGKDPWPSFLPPDPTPPLKINWRSVTKRGVDGWLLAMVPAFLTILLSFRLRRESLWAELVERPWWPVSAMVFWPVGLWTYVGQPGIIERRLKALTRAYREEHQAEPSQEWLAAQRLIQMRKARDVQSALLEIQNYPELIRVNSRSAILASWILAMTAGPMSLMIGVVQAYANVARVNGGTDTTQIDTTRTSRRRDVSGRAFGVMTYNGDRGFNLGTLWGIITMQNGRVTGDAWVDLKQPTVMQASATVAVNDQLGLEAGRIWTPVGYSLPGPDNGLFPASSLGSHFPAAAGDGVALHATTTRASLVASAQSGTTPQRTDVNLFAKARTGPLKVFGGIHSGSQHFRFGQFEASWLGLLLREMVVENLDRRSAAASTDIVYQRGVYRGGVHLEHDRWQVSLERKLDPHSRAVIHLGQTDGVAGTAITGKVQYGFAMAP